MPPILDWSSKQHKAAPFSPETSASPQINVESWHVVVPFSDSTKLFMLFDTVMAALSEGVTAVTFLYFCRSSRPNAEIFRQLKGIHAIGQAYLPEVYVKLCEEGIFAEICLLKKVRPIDAILVDKSRRILSEMDAAFCQSLTKEGLTVKPLCC